MKYNIQITETQNDKGVPCVEFEFINVGSPMDSELIYHMVCDWCIENMDAQDFHAAYYGILTMLYIHDPENAMAAKLRWQ